MYLPLTELSLFIIISLTFNPHSHSLPLRPSSSSFPTLLRAVYGTCQQAAEELMARCQDAETRKACGAASNGECAWDADAEECSARQAPWIAALLGAGGRAAAAARACAAIKSPGACAAAGQVEIDAPAAVKALFAAPATAATTAESAAVNAS